MEEEDVLKLLIDDGDEFNDFDIDEDIEEELLRDDPHPRFVRTASDKNVNVKNDSYRNDHDDNDDAIDLKTDDDIVRESRFSSENESNNDSLKRKDDVSNSNNSNSHNKKLESSSNNKNKKRKFDKNKNTRNRNNFNNDYDYDYNNRRNGERGGGGGHYNNNKYNNMGQPPKRPLLFNYPSKNLFLNPNSTIPVINTNPMNNNNNFLPYPNSIPPNSFDMMSPPPSQLPALMPTPANFSQPLLMSSPMPNYSSATQNFNLPFNNVPQSQPLLSTFPQNQFNYEHEHESSSFQNSFSNEFNSNNHQQFNSFPMQNTNISQNNILVPMRNSNISQNNNIQVPMQNTSNNYGLNSPISHTKTLISNSSFNNKPIQLNARPAMNYNDNSNNNNNSQQSNALFANFNPIQSNFGNSILQQVSNQSSMLPNLNQKQTNNNFGQNSRSNKTLQITNFNNTNKQQSFNSREFDYQDKNESDLYEPDDYQDDSDLQNTSSTSSYQNNGKLQQQNTYSKLKPPRPMLTLRPMPPHMIKNINSPVNTTNVNANSTSAFHKNNSVNNISPNKPNQVRQTFTIQNQPKPFQATVPNTPTNIRGVRPPNATKNVYKLNQPQPAKGNNPMDRAEKMKKLQEALERNEKIKKLQESIAKLKDDFGIDDDYMKKIENQKKMREKIAEAKANKRKIFAAVCNNTSSTEQITTTSTSLEQPAKAVSTTTTASNIVAAATVVSSKVVNQSKAKNSPSKKKQQQQAKSAQKLDQNNSLKTTAANSLQIISDKLLVVEEGKQSSEVKIFGLDSNIRESAIRKLCRPHGMVQSIEFFFDPDVKGRYALVKFEKMSEAQTFVKQCQNQQLDACTITVTFNWFVF